MSTSNARDEDRLKELLADEASAALDSSDAPELTGLLKRHRVVVCDELLQAAALAQVAFLRRGTVHRMPAGLKERLASEGAALVSRQRAQRPIARLPQTVNDAPDVITLPWAPPAAAGYQGVTGDVVWSQSRQQGYLRLAHMPVNDPARTQYQLWIVDPERDTHPVDGGVFNVSTTGEVIIPIQAKLPIRSPKAFAITAEQPGGVVVSAGPLLVVASI